MLLKMTFLTTFISIKKLYNQIWWNFVFNLMNKLKIMISPLKIFPQHLQSEHSYHWKERKISIQKCWGLNCTNLLEVEPNLYSNRWALWTTRGGRRCTAHSSSTGSQRRGARQWRWGFCFNGKKSLYLHGSRNVFFFIVSSRLNLILRA